MWKWMRFLYIILKQKRGKTLFYKYNIIKNHVTEILLTDFL